MANNIAYGMPARIGLDIPAATAILGGFVCSRWLDMLLATRPTPESLAYMLVASPRSLWIAAIILDRVGILSATSPYRDSILAQGLAIHHIGPGDSGGHHDHCDASDCPFREPATTSPIVAATILAPSRCYAYVPPAPTGGRAIRLARGRSVGSATQPAYAPPPQDRPHIRA